MYWPTCSRQSRVSCQEKWRGTFSINRGRAVVHVSTGCLTLTERLHCPYCYLNTYVFVCAGINHVFMWEKYTKLSTKLQTNNGGINISYKLDFLNFLLNFCFIFTISEFGLSVQNWKCLLLLDESLYLN